MGKPDAVSVIQVLFLMLEHLTVQFVDEVVYGRVEVFLGVFCKKVCAVDVNGSFCFL